MPSRPVLYQTLVWANGPVQPGFDPLSGSSLSLHLVVQEPRAALDVMQILKAKEANDCTLRPSRIKYNHAIE